MAVSAPKVSPITRIVFTLCIALAPLCARSSPFLYIWSEPGASSSRYSNVAPPWYRTPLQSAEGARVIGPRVKVYYGSVLVDDTALSPDARRALVPPPPSAKGRDNQRSRSF